MTEQQKNILLEERKAISSNLGDCCKWFADERALSDSGYFSDMVSEMSDSLTSVYYSDQYKYWDEHQEDCENALLELYDSENIAEMIRKNGLYDVCCKAGALGEMFAYEQELNENKKDIMICIIIDYLININEFLTLEEIENIADLDYDEMNDYAEEVNNKIKLGE